jgi:hypothetical protein
LKQQADEETPPEEAPVFTAAPIDEGAPTIDATESTLILGMLHRPMLSCRLFYCFSFGT